MGGRAGKDRDKSCRCSLALSIAPDDVIAVKDWGVTSTGQNRGAEAATRPGCSAHIEAKPRVRTEKKCKGWQPSVNCHHQTKDLADAGTRSSHGSLES